MVMILNYLNFKHLFKVFCFNFKTGLFFFENGNPFIALLQTIGAILLYNSWLILRDIARYFWSWIFNSSEQRYKEAAMFIFEEISIFYFFPLFPIIFIILKFFWIISFLGIRIFVISSTLLLKYLFQNYKVRKLFPNRFLLLSYIKRLRVWWLSYLGWYQDRKGVLMYSSCILALLPLHFFYNINVLDKVLYPWLLQAIITSMFKATDWLIIFLEGILNAIYTTLYIWDEHLAYFIFDASRREKLFLIRKAMIPCLLSLFPTSLLMAYIIEKSSFELG